MLRKKIDEHVKEKSLLQHNKKSEERNTKSFTRIIVIEVNYSLSIVLCLKNK